MRRFGNFSCHVTEVTYSHTIGHALYDVQHAETPYFLLYESNFLLTFNRTDLLHKRKFSTSDLSLTENIHLALTFYVLNKRASCPTQPLTRAGKNRTQLDGSVVY